MSNSTETPGGIVVVPTPKPARTIGILNIVFGTILALWAVFSAFTTLMSPYMMRINLAQQARMREQFNASMEKDRQTTLNRLADEEKAAETEEQKQEIQKRRQEVLSRPLMQYPDVSGFMQLQNDRSIKIVAWVTIVTGLLLNVPLILTGIALMQMKEWGRKTSVWIGWLKLGRLAILLAVAMLVTMPILMDAMEHFFADFGRSMQQSIPGPQGANVAQVMRTMARVYGAIVAGGYVFYYIVAAVYPIIMIKILGKPGVRAATQGVALESKPELPAGEFA